MKKLLAVFLLSLMCMPAFADVELKDINEANVREPSFRVGLTDDPEKKYVEIKQNIYEDSFKADKSQIDTEDLTYADLSIKRMSKEISKELELDETDMYEDLTLLWQGAASKSDTINFALYKLANPDEGKPNEHSVKKVLMTIASMSTLVGAGVGNPVIAAGSMLGSNIFSIMGQDTKALNYKYTKVTDADMIMLIRKIEDLQQLTVDLYQDYMAAKKQLDLTTQIADQRKRYYESAQSLSREIVLITDAYYRTALDEQVKARSDFYTKRAALEQFVGNEVFEQFEKNLTKRENDL
ncbi:hypothetical protein IKP85_05050 [bacterium]|nr:hypothetical protein [bacterium]